MFENDGELPFKKKAKKKMAKKSDHKHVYVKHDVKDDGLTWYDTVEICTICGKKGNTFFNWGKRSLKL